MNTQTAYCDVFYQPGDNPVFCYRSGLMVYEETLYQGVLVSSGYNTAGYPLNVLTQCPTRLNHRLFTEPSAFHLEIDGQSLDYGLKFVDFQSERSGESIQSVLVLESSLKPVRIKVHTLLDSTQMFTRFLEIENLSGDYQNLSRLSLLSGGLECMDATLLTENKDINQYYSVGYFEHTEVVREGEFVWHDLTPDVLSIDTRFHRERHRHPAVFIRNNVTGVMYFSQIGWSGGCRFTLDYHADRTDYSHTNERKKVLLSFDAEITSYNPMMVLRPGEVFSTPEVHMGAIQGGLDEAVNEMHAHIRKSVLNWPEADGSACLVGAGMGAEHDMSVETSKAFIRQFAQMGAEVFIIDAGWFCPPGDLNWGKYNGLNVPHAQRYPNGIAELSDYCHEHGLKFALWTEIERVGKAAGIHETHPEWFACGIYGDHYRGFCNDFCGHHSGEFLDFTVPEAAEWAENELARIITEYKLDLLRVDYNVLSQDFFNLRDTTGSGRKECLSIRHFNAVYKMYQNLKKRFPHVIFENCASGGGRTDLGHMKAFNHTWVSDWQRSPHSVLITNGMTMVLPPERVDRLFAGMGCHAAGSLDLHMRNTMLTHMSLNVVAPAATQANPLQMEFVKHSVEIYKNFIRKFLPHSNVYHHTPDVFEALDHGFCALEIASSDGRQGAVGAFVLTDAKKESYTVCPRGIQAHLTYRVTLDNSGAVLTMKGYDLMTQGVTVRIPASLSSELILLEAID